MQGLVFVLQRTAGGIAGSSTYSGSGAVIVYSAAKVAVLPHDGPDVPPVLGTVPVAEKDAIAPPFKVPRLVADVEKMQ